MCGNVLQLYGKAHTLGPHINAGPDWAPGGISRRHPAPPGVDPQILADQQASIAASQAAAAFNRKRIASSLVAGSRGVIGKPSALGAAAAIAPGARVNTAGGSAYGSALGAAAGAGR